VPQDTGFVMVELRGGVRNVRGIRSSVAATASIADVDGRPAVGVLLGAGGGGYTPEGFRLAWTVQYVVWGGALAGVLVARRRARRKLADEGVVVEPLLRVLAERRRARRSTR